MTNDWIDNLEAKLNKKLSDFLRENPYQANLLNKSISNDFIRSLKKQKEYIRNNAKEYRKQLLSLAEDIREWQQRSIRARKAGEVDLANRADKYVNKLKEEGRTLWIDLTQLGDRFKKIEKLTVELSKKDSELNQKPNLEKAWDQFEINQELNKLKEKHHL